MRLQPFRGSHLPVLMKIVQNTDGPILELGCGTYSTQYLHWICFAAKRRLVTYENNPQYYEYLRQFATDYHEIRCVPDWPSIDVSEPWTVALVDGDPGPRRILVEKLFHAEYVVCHDTEGRASRKHEYAQVFPRFKYQFEYKVTNPHTTLLSNVHDIRKFRLP